MTQAERTRETKEQTMQIRLTLGETMGRLAPDVQAKHQQCLDALERIDRIAEHGVAPGESAPRERPGTRADGLPEEKQKQLKENEEFVRRDEADTARVRAMTRPSDTDVKADADEQPKAKAEAKAQSKK